MAIKAITFDLWDTLVHDDSDEEERARRNLRSKREERRHLLWEALNGQQETVFEDVVLAYNTADAASNLSWKQFQITWTLLQRLNVVLDGLGRSLPEPVFRQLVDESTRMEADIPPRAVDGAGDALAALAGRYRLGVVADSMFTPGRGLRQILARHELLGHFNGLAFSDEVGHCKPNRMIFLAAASQLDVTASETIHVGARQENDIRGAQALGAKTVLFTGARDADAGATSAEAICGSMADLPGVVARLAEDAE